MLDPVHIESLDLDARGVTRLIDSSGRPGKVIFVEGALPGEWVTYKSYRIKSKFEQAHLLKIFKSSVMRIEPQCSFFDRCGGCSMQHIDPRAQLAMKQRVLEDNLKYLAKTRPEVLLRPIAGPAWGYRYRARLSVRLISKNGVLVGFHEKKKSYVADISSCDILPKNISALLPSLRRLVASLSISDRIPQIEVAIGEGDDPGESLSVLVFRHLKPLAEGDLEKLSAFEEESGVRIWLQPRGPDSVHPLISRAERLCYRLPEFGIEIPFKPTDFTQVNHQINRVLVGRAVRLLDLTPDEKVIDLFCGIGNFTLPLATIARQAFGVEGSQTLTNRARVNAHHNGLSHKVDFACANLFDVSPDVIRSWGAAPKWLIDPPRDGAMAVAQALAALHQSSDLSDHAFLPERIVYVSCNPATLARDVSILIHTAGYVLKSAGVVNMFPHTSHIESIAVFERATQ